MNCADAIRSAPSFRVLVGSASQPSPSSALRQSQQTAAPSGRLDSIARVVKGGLLPLFVSADYRSTHIPGTATFWKRWGEATVESGYWANLAWKCGSPKALRNASTDSQMA
jgi:hypothetical protein